MCNNNANRKPSALSIGEIIWDIYPDERHIGGAPLNFAAHLAACGVNSSLMSGVGDDELGREALSVVDKFGVNTEFIETNAFPSGICAVTLDASGVPSYNLAINTAYDNVNLDDACIDRIACKDFDAVAFGTIIQRSPALRARIRELLSRVRFGTVFCDVNLRPNCYDADSARYCMSTADILKVSTEEEPTLRALGLYSAPDSSPASVARAICSAYPNIRELILTDGAKGAYCFDSARDELIFEGAIPVTVVSTVGAGDSFGAAYLASRLLGEPMQEALVRAVRRSAFVVAHADAVPIESD